MDELPYSRMVILRHGESHSNLNRVYSGWYDTDLTQKGISESYSAAALLKEEGFKFDICYTSALKRAIRTLWITQDVLNQMHIPTVSSWRLNECHFGAFTGLNREDILNQFGEDTIEKWKSSFNFVPPPISQESIYHPIHDKKYLSLDPAILPNAESLEMLNNRIDPFYQDEIFPSLMQGKTVLLVGHGNVMRSFIKRFENLTGEEIMKRPVTPNGYPLVFEFDRSMNLISSQMLGDKEKAKKSIYLSDGIL